MYHFTYIPTACLTCSTYPNLQGSEQAANVVERARRRGKKHENSWLTEITAPGKHLDAPLTFTASLSLSLSLSLPSSPGGIDFSALDLSKAGKQVGRCLDSRANERSTSRELTVPRFCRTTASSCAPRRGDGRGDTRDRRIRENWTVAGRCTARLIGLHFRFFRGSRSRNGRGQSSQNSGLDSSSGWLSLFLNRAAPFDCILPFFSLSQSNRIN